MKINTENDLVELTPENDEEKKSLEKLWNVMVDCAKFNKKMVPIGEYVPSTSTLARFHIEE